MFPLFSSDSLTNVKNKWAKESLASQKKSRVWSRNIKNLAKNSVAPVICEVGVAKGGGLAIAGHILSHEKYKNSVLYGFDVFNGRQVFSDIDEADPTFEKLLNAEEMLSSRKGLAEVSLDQVKSLVSSTGFSGQINLVEGDAANTIPNEQLTAKDLQIDLLRISVNFYNPVFAAMTHLVPLVKPGGVVWMDGIGFWPGFRQAVTDSSYLSSLVFQDKVEDLEIYKILA